MSKMRPLTKLVMARFVNHRIHYRKRSDYNEDLFEVHFALDDIMEYKARDGAVEADHSYMDDEGRIVSQIDDIGGVKIATHAGIKRDQAWIMCDGEIIEVVEHPGS